MKQPLTNRKWTPERRRRFIATLAARKRARTGGAPEQPIMSDAPTNVKEFIEAVEHSLHNLKNVLGITEGD